MMYGKGKACVVKVEAWHEGCQDSVLTSAPNKLGSLGHVLLPYAWLQCKLFWVTSALETVTAVESPKQHSNTKSLYEIL